MIGHIIKFKSVIDNSASSLQVSPAYPVESKVEGIFQYLGYYGSSDDTATCLVCPYRCQLLALVVQLPLTPGELP